jgi:hypothetical protein
MTAADEHHCHPFFFLSNLQHAIKKNSTGFSARFGCMVVRWRLSFDGFIDSRLKTDEQVTHCGFSMPFCQT